MEEYDREHKDHDQLEGKEGIEEDSWKYEKPTLEKAERMDFMFSSISSLYPNKSCRQCSSCHGCR